MSTTTTTMASSRSGRRNRWLVGSILVQVCAQLVLTGRPARAQCPEKTMTSFERIGSVMIKDAPLSILFMAPNASLMGPGGGAFGHLSAEQQLSRQLLSGASAAALATASSLASPITAECNNRCRRSARCRAFLVDYSRHTCWSVEQPLGAGGLSRGPTPIQLAPTTERTAYFEKVCLNLPVVDCERAWVYERVMGHHLQGLDDKIIDEVSSRLKCQEHCLNERDFRCRSGEYDYVTMQCRLSALDRHVKPAAFRPTSSNVDYFENQCVSIGTQCDAFDRFDDLDLGRPEIMRLANTSDQCQQYCTQTIKAFICRSFTWSPLTGKCYLNSANSNMVGGLDKLIQAPGLIYYQRNDCIDLKLDCDTTAMTLNLRTNEPFRGRMYVRDDPSGCETLGRSSLVSSLSIPFQSVGARCAQRELPSRYSSVVVVQQHPLIQRKSDRYIKLVCDFQTANKTITSAYNVVANPWTSTALINGTSFAPKIRLRITDKFGNDVTGAKLGDELQLRIEAESESVYDMVARSVLAKSGQTDESIVLIDRDGCPADYRIFPPLRKLNRRTIIGKFDAFKFSSDVIVRFQVDVQFCLNACPLSQCEPALQQQQQNLLLNPQHLPSTSSPPPPLGETASASASASGPPPESYVGLTSGSLASTPSTPPASDQPPPPPPPVARQPPGAGGHFMTPLASNSLAADAPLAQQAPPTQTGGRRAPAALMNWPAANQPLVAAGAGGQQDPEGQMFELAARFAAARPADQSSSSPAPVSTSRDMFRNSISADQLAEQSSRQQEANSNDNSHRGRRRRRSAEPLPTVPKHVPLQREIIVIESPSQPAKDQQQATGGQPAAKRGRDAPSGVPRQEGELA